MQNNDQSSLQMLQHITEQQSEESEKEKALKQISRFAAKVNERDALESAKIQNSNSSNFENNEELEELDSTSNVWKPIIPQEPTQPQSQEPQATQATQAPKTAICVNVLVDLENVSSQQVEAITKDLQAYLNAKKKEQDSSPQPDTNASKLTFSTQKGMETVAAFLLPLSVALLDQVYELLICPFGDKLFLRQDQGFLLVERPSKNDQEASKT